MTITRAYHFFAAALLAATLAPSFALAHGEKALEPFIRMRSVQWYDVAWSKTKASVNDEVVVTGKFHVADDWPRGVPKPDAAYLNISVPGPVFVRTERYVNGQPSASSFSLKLGGDYEFKIVLKARLPGKYHVHPFFNLHDAGAVMGPGQWFEITGDASAFSNEVKTIEGAVVDMETYGLANGVAWHAFWLCVGAAWLLWWVRRPLFLPRYKMLLRGQEDALVTRLDKQIAFGLLIGVPAVVGLAYYGAVRNTPNAIPLQASLDQIEPLAPVVNTGAVDVRIRRTEYNVPSHAMKITADVHNASSEPLRLGEFASANLRFIDHSVAPITRSSEDAEVAPNGLRVDLDEAIPPNETRTLRITAEDALWRRERLDGLVFDADSRLGALLFFYSPGGERRIVSVSTPIVPKFN